MNREDSRPVVSASVVSNEQAASELGVSLWRVAALIANQRLQRAVDAAGAVGVDVVSLNEEKSRRLNSTRLTRVWWWLSDVAGYVLP